MNNFRFKRFDTIEQNKRRIIENTRKQIQQPYPAPKQQKRTGFYVASIVAVTSMMLVFIGVLISMQDTDTPLQANPMPAETFSFKGDLVGTLTYNQQQFLFQPTNDSLDFYPEIDGKITYDTKIKFSQEAAVIIQQHTKIDDGARIENVVFSLEIVKEDNYYVAIAVEVIQLQHDSISYDMFDSFTLSYNKSGEFVLDAPLQAVYEAFLIDYDVTKLRGLKPKDIFQLYNYAVEQDDVKATYSLIIDEPQIAKPTYEEFEDGWHQEESSNFSATHENSVFYVSITTDIDTGAYIFTKYLQYTFGLSKNSDDIWLVNYLPNQ